MITRTIHVAVLADVIPDILDWLALQEWETQLTHVIRGAGSLPVRLRHVASGKIGRGASFGVDEKEARFFHDMADRIPDSKLRVADGYHPNYPDEPDFDAWLAGLGIERIA